MKKTELVVIAERCSESHRQVGRINALLDVLGASEHPDAHVRLASMLRECIEPSMFDRLSERDDGAYAAIGALKKLAEIYEQEHGPDRGSQTHPWTIVRWAKSLKG